MAFPLKSKNRAAIWPCKTTPGRISGEKHDPKACMCPNCSLKHCLQWPRHGSDLMSTDRGMDREYVVHTYKGISVQFSPSLSRVRLFETL